MNTAMEQKRKNRRYNLCLPVRLRSKKGEEAAVEAVTRDLSATGIYLILSAGVEVESELNLELTLPPQLTGGKSVRIRCLGRIVRVEHRAGDGPLGVAATIEEYEFLKND